jgi:hypothetical protein
LLAFSHITEYNGIKNRQNDGQNGTMKSFVKMGNEIIQWTPGHSQNKIHNGCSAEFWGLVGGIQPCAQNSS